MSISQGEAVFQAVVEVVGEVNGVVELNKAQLKEVHERVFAMFADGTTVHAKNPTPEQLRKYIPGLVNNWLRKDKRLNGGVKYTPKNLGSRSGSGDESVKAMRQLLSVTTDPAIKAEIQASIDARLEELKPKVVVNVAALPEALRHLVS